MPRLALPLTEEDHNTLRLIRAKLELQIGKTSLIVAVRYALRLAAQLLSGEPLPLPAGWLPDAHPSPADNGRPPRPPR
jgi:hypothetical protein